MGASILLVAHEPLASALHAVARHAYTECNSRVMAVDVPSTFSIEQATSQVRAVLETLGDQDVLVLVDAYGATPCNAAMAAAVGRSVRIVAGVNVAMLWRTLCYVHLPFEEVASRAVDGGRCGVMHVPVPV